MKKLQEVLFIKIKQTTKNKLLLEFRDIIISLREALVNLSLPEFFDLFLEKTPSSIDISDLRTHILKIGDVTDVHHIHVWSIDGYNNYATMHIVASKNIIKVYYL